MPATIPIEAFARSASGKTMLGDLPPSSSVTRTSRSPAIAAMRRPVSVPPVNAILETSGCRTSASPASAPKPVTTLTTPGGMPASSTSGISSSSDAEVCSLGLITIVFPPASAGASFISVSRSGEFQGVIAPTTPIGWRRV